MGGRYHICGGCGKRTKTSYALCRECRLIIDMIIREFNGKLIN